jgi:membrane fusion protein (multidrug efflux system)
MTIKSLLQHEMNETVRIQAAAALLVARAASGSSVTRASQIARGAVAAAMVLTLACSREAPKAPAEGGEAAIVTIGPENIAVVEQTELSTGPALSGQLTAERTASIRAEVSGSIVQVMREPGERVAAGATLVKIDDTSISDMFLSARSGVTSAQTAADQTQRELQRAERLHQAGAISERELEAARNASIAAQAQLADARARLASAQKQLDATVVKAPFNGIVAERQVSAGDVVAPGTALFTIIDPASMRLEAAVPAANLPDVRVGMPVRFTVSGYGKRAFEGRITNVNPAADPATGQVRIYVSIPNAGGQLVTGLFAQGRVATERRRGLSAPVSAVDQRGLRPFVVRLRNGSVERIEVTPGVRDEERERLEISGGGIAAGDTLLTGAAQGITPGSRVHVSAARDTTR